MDDTSNWLCMNLLLTSIGAGAFLYGRRQRRGFPFLVGAALIATPYFTDSLLWLLLLGMGLLALLALGPRLGIDF